MRQDLSKRLARIETASPPLDPISALTPEEDRYILDMFDAAFEGRELPTLAPASMARIRKALAYTAELYAEDKRRGVA